MPLIVNANYYNMKKILLLFVAIAVSACSDDDTTTNAYNGSIIGTWKTVEATYNNETFITTDCETNDNMAPAYTYRFIESNQFEFSHTCWPTLGISYGTYTFSDGIVRTLEGDDTVPTKYNVTQAGANRIKISLIDSESDYTAILEKQ